MIVVIKITADFAHESLVTDRLVAAIRPLTLPKPHPAGVFTLEVPPEHEERIRKALDDLRVEGLEFK